LATLPLVGVLVALLLYAWLGLSTLLGFGPLLFAAGLTLLPLALTGGIHLDGFCDTVDALSSRAPLERKREILKDPHVGAFAVIGIVAWLLAYFALCTELAPTVTTVGILGAVAVMSRAAAGFASLTFPSAQGDGLLDTLRGAASEEAAKTQQDECGEGTAPVTSAAPPSLAVIFNILWFVLAAAVAFVLDWRTAVAITAVMLLITLFVRIMSRRQFGGMSGDLAGFLIQLAELGAVAALVLLEKVVVLL
jgi:adenosylcobinamide-GDP ribazoletransferase